MNIIEINRDFYRLIPSRFPPIQVFHGLVANDLLHDVAVAESRTNPRLTGGDRTVFENGPPSHRLQNFNHAPFKYINPEGSLFFPSYRPALEMSDSRQTALAVAVARRERFLRRTAEPPTGLDMRLLKTPVKGRFADFTSLNPDLSSADRQAAASKLDQDDVQGILFRPSERHSHQCCAVLDGRVLGYTLQTSHYRFWWDGSRIGAIYAFDPAQHFDPAILGNVEDVLAA